MEEIQTIIYKQKMDRAPTSEDRTKRVGIRGFFEQLQKDGWIDENHNQLKKFDVVYEGHAEQGNNYIQWTAILHRE